MKGREKKKTKVVVAMSGGVDSSVTAALLKKANFDVIGVFLKLSDFPKLKEAEEKAGKVAKFLKIPFLVLDLRKEFKKRVVNYFLEGYRKGITPNPCVTCNKEIKFGLLLEKALKMDADFVATGHYARKGELKTDNLKLATYKLLKARDRDKDQSYFLWKLNQKQLKRVLFPIGNYKRRKVEELAREFKLPVLKTKKSVEICFIPNADLRGFLKTRTHAENGKIISVDGQSMGGHKGLAFYTIGQRKGIRLPGGPYYVLDKDLKKNLLIVTKNEKDLFKKELICRNVNWISPKQSLRDATGQAGKEPKLPIRAEVKIRYRHQPALAIITRSSGFKVYRLKFVRAQRAITPGQSAVFYKGNELLGGGIICSVRSF